MKARVAQCAGFLLLKIKKNLLKKALENFRELVNEISC